MTNRDNMQEKIAQALYTKTASDTYPWDMLSDVGKQRWYGLADIALGTIAAHFDGASHIDLSTWEGVVAEHVNVPWANEDLGFREGLYALRPLSPQGAR